MKRFKGRKPVAISATITGSLTGHEKSFRYEERVNASRGPAQLTEEFNRSEGSAACDTTVG